MHRPQPRRLLLVLTAVLTLAWLGAAGLLATGQAALVVTHGISMAPLYHQGDLVVITRKPAYRVGDVVGYHRPGHRDVVLHRIVGGDPTGWVFQGDNNAALDPTRPTQQQLAGRAALHIPRGGLWLGRLTSPPVLAVLAFVLLAGGGAAQDRRRRRTRRTTVSRHAARPSSPLAVTTLPPPFQAAAGLAAVVGLAGLTVGALAFSGPLTTAGIATSQVTGASMTFSYAAEVGRSPAYDGTTVTSPDPVFRSRTRTVVVTYAYRGAPGNLSVVAELSTPGGWRSTIPLRAPVRAGSAYQGAVTLDLSALEARAEAGAAATGLPAGPVSVALTTRVQPTYGAAFAPALQLTLSPVQLTLSGSAADLVVADTATTQRPVQVPRRLGVLGRSITAETARILAPLLLLGALVAGGLLAVVGRRLAPSGEAAQIRSRYAGLLVRVHPMPTPAGRPVIEVTEFATLAKLAERYGLLVLHWSRSDVETFVVQDESTTYRYRPGTHDVALDEPTAAAADVTPAR